MVDVEPDGRDEILYGGNTAVTNYWAVAVFVDGKIRKVPVEGRQLVLVQGLLEVEGRRQTRTQEFGCEDVDGDGRRELVQVTAELEGDTLRWTKEAYRLEGASAVRVATASGTAPAPDEPLWVADDDLVAPCGLRLP